MQKVRKSAASFLGLVVTISSLVFLSLGALSLLGFLFAIPKQETRHSELDNPGVGIENLLQDRL